MALSYLRQPLIRLALLALLGSATLVIGFRYWDTETWQDTLGHWLADRQSYNKNQDLLLGSSTIKHLQPDRDLACGTWLKRGIGNSQIPDLLRYLQYSPLDIKPEKIVLYAGENDLARQYDIDSTFAAYQQLIRYLNSRFPAAELHLLAIKPSPKRSDLYAQIITLNQLLQQFAASSSQLFFHNAEWSNAVAANEPIFRTDGVHLSAAGYRLLTRSFNLSCTGDNAGQTSG